MQSESQLSTNKSISRILHLCDTTNNLVASFRTVFAIINFSDLIFCLKNTFKNEYSSI